MGRPDPLSRLARPAAGWLLLAGLAGGCALPTGSAAAPASPGPASAVSTPPSAPPPVASERPSPGPARQGTRAPSQVDRYAPEELVLPGNVRADVVPAATVDGQLVVPTDVERLGWWDGSAYLGDPFGATVIAGHVDSATQGIGIFARLLRIEVGDRVRVLGEGQRQTYEVISVRPIAKGALATDGGALDQTGDHRLVLITCTGAYRPDRGGYDQNLVVTAKRV